MLLPLFRRECNHFRAAFNADTRRLFFSNQFKTAARPITSIFVAAFIWNITHSLVPVALYSGGSFIGLVIAFFVNGHLLRRFCIRTLYWIGAVGDGLAVILVIFFSAGQLGAIALYGLLWGLGRGLYWSNRNYLELQETTNSNRQYFFSIGTAIDWISGIIIPFIAGWFIVFGERVGWFQAEHGYWILFVLAVALMVMAAIVISGGSFTSVAPGVVTRFRIQRRLNGRRVLNATNGMIDGISFLSPLLILAYVGREGALGTISSLVAVLSACATYAYGRFVNGRHQYTLMIVSGSAYIASAVALAVLPPPASVLAFVLLSPVAAGFFSIAVNPILLSLTDGEMNGNGAMRYSFIFDNEFFLNAGRVVGIVFLLGLAWFGSEVAGLLYGPLVVAFTVVIALMVFVIRRRR